MPNEPSIKRQLREEQEARQFQRDRKKYDSESKAERLKRELAEDMKRGLNGGSASQAAQKEARERVLAGRHPLRQLGW